MPRGQLNERSALTLLALLDLKPAGAWNDLKRPLMGITPIMEYCREHYGREYAPNTRETFGGKRCISSSSPVLRATTPTDRTAR